MHCWRLLLLLTSPENTNTTRNQYPMKVFFVSTNHKGNRASSIYRFIAKLTEPLNKMAKSLETIGRVSKSKRYDPKQKNTEDFFIHIATTICTKTANNIYIYMNETDCEKERKGENLSNSFNEDWKRFTYCLIDNDKNKFIFLLRVAIIYLNFIGSFVKENSASCLIETISLNMDIIFDQQKQISLIKPNQIPS